MRYFLKVISSCICVLLIFSINFSFSPLYARIIDSKENSILELVAKNLKHHLDDNPNIKGKILSVEPLKDSGGSFINDVYLLKTTEMEELIIKIANPNWERFKTLNEVNAITFLKNNTTIPVPTIVAYEDDKKRSCIGREYIVMHRMNGKALNLVYNDIKNDQNRKKNILSQLAKILSELRSYKFDRMGSFYRQFDYKNKIKPSGVVDYPGCEGINSLQQFSDYSNFSLGYYLSEMKKKIQEGSLDEALYRKYSASLQHLIDKKSFDILNTVGESFVFSHQDFVMKNILIDLEANKVTAILDWEWSGSASKEVESMSGLDFLQTDEDKAFFEKELEKNGVYDFFNKLSIQRQTYYRLIGHVYTLIAYREWKVGKLEHTAKFLSQKLEQRKIRNDPDFDLDSFIKSVMQDLDYCIEYFSRENIGKRYK